MQTGQRAAAMKVKDLGEKVDVLRGFPDCAAHLLTVANCRQEDTIAERLGVAGSAWAHMKKGRRDISLEQAGRLLGLFGIGSVPGDVFFKPKNTFQKIVEPIGLTGKTRLGVLFSLWEQAEKYERLSILQVAKKGIAGSRTGTLQLRIDDNVRIEINHRTGGYLALFDIGPSEITLVVPSLFQTDTGIDAGRTVLPGPRKQFPVTGPAGSYWLLAAITADNPTFPTWLPRPFTVDRPTVVLTDEMQQEVHEKLQAARIIECLACPYEVIHGVP